jgi:hypothetical protein
VKRVASTSLESNSSYHIRGLKHKTGDFNFNDVEGIKFETNMFILNSTVL